MLKDVEFVYFDLDDTLLDHRHAEQQAVAALCEDFSGALGGFSHEEVQATYHQHNVSLWAEYAAGKLNRPSLQRLRFELLLKSLKIDSISAAAIGEAYMAHYAKFWRVLPDAVECFQTIADQYPVGILTNGFADVQKEKLRLFPDVAARLSALVVSEEVGVLKPNKEIFDYAARAAKTPPERILYVGDSLSSDVHGGLDAGWKVAWYRPSAEAGSLPPDRAVGFKDWSDLTDLLVNSAPGQPAIPGQSAVTSPIDARR